MEINRERKNPFIGVSFNPVYERSEMRKAIYVIPDIFPAGIEDMWPVLVKEYLCGRIPFCMTVAPDMGPRLKDRYVT